MVKVTPIVITINHKLGSGGTYLGDRIAKKLNMMYINHQIIELTAQKINISSENVTFTMEDRRGRSDSVKVFVNFMYQNIHINLDGNLQNIFNKGTPEELAKLVDGLDTLEKLMSN